MSVSRLRRAVLSPAVSSIDKIVSSASVTDWKRFFCVVGPGRPSSVSVAEFGDVVTPRGVRFVCDKCSRCRSSKQQPKTERSKSSEKSHVKVGLSGRRLLFGSSSREPWQRRESVFPRTMATKKASVAVIPPSIVFEDAEVGCIHRQTFSVQNCSPTGKEIRFRGPATQVSENLT